MIDLTEHLAEIAPQLDETFRNGVTLALAGVKPREDYAIVSGVRARHGFKARAADLLTAPDANYKLDKAIVPTYGLTLAHFRTALPAVGGRRSRINGAVIDFPALSINACPNAGHCVKVCVLNNGNGRYDSVQRAWRWRTDLLTRHPDSFARILAFELVRAVRKHGNVLFRPNVNSDVAWQRILPSLTDGYVAGVLSYGYSKRPETLAGDGWLGRAYRVAYSWNERSDRDEVTAFLVRGGAVAVVTARKKGQPVLREFPFGWTCDVADADVTDEWLLTKGAVIGDLSAKGKARELIGRSRFVVGAA
jgi:hypothetical protein